ncbi:MAG: hypothetical protein AAB222_07675, partial [Candidatus Binatota bacterium]
DGELMSKAMNARLKPIHIRILRVSFAVKRSDVGLGRVESPRNSGVLLSTRSRVPYGVPGIHACSVTRMNGG